MRQRSSTVELADEVETEKKKKRSLRNETRMFWRKWQGNQGKKDKKEKRRVRMWRGKKEKKKKEKRRVRVWRRKKKGKKSKNKIKNEKLKLRNAMTIFSQYFHNKF